MDPVISGSFLTKGISPEQVEGKLKQINEQAERRSLLHRHTHMLLPLLECFWPQEIGWFMFIIYHCHHMRNNTHREKPDGTWLEKDRRKKRALIICKPENTCLGETAARWILTLWVFTSGQSQQQRQKRIKKRKSQPATPLLPSPPAHRHPGDAQSSLLGPETHLETESMSGSQDHTCTPGNNVLSRE